MDTDKQLTLRIITLLPVMLMLPLQGQVHFSEISAEAGVQAQIQARGVCVFDYNNDGFADIFVTNHQGDDLLFRNDGNMSFTEVGETAGVSNSGASQVAVAADYDADGDTDLFVGVSNNLSKLYRNDGDGMFTEVSMETGLIHTGNVFGGAWGDYNNDGKPDLYIANLGDRNYLFENTGGSFIDVTFDVGAQGPMNDLCMQAIFLDYDDDGDMEIIGTQDGYRGNYLLSMQMYGMYANIASEANIVAADVLQGMGIISGDYDRDGWFDLYVTNLNENLLFRNNGDGTFSNVSQTANVQDQPMSMAWGTVFIDADNDGWLDIFSNNESGFGGVPSSFFYNNGNGTFIETSMSAGLYLYNSGYGCAAGDFDSDGDQDLVVVGYDVDNGVLLFENDTQIGNHWLQIRLKGNPPATESIGTVVEVWSDGMLMKDMVTAGSGFCSQNSFDLQFGLGEKTAVDSIIIHWPSGDRTYFPDEIDRLYQIRENDYCIPTGDITGDHALDILDIVAAVAYILYDMALDDTQICQSDLNNDGITDILDVLRMVNQII